MDQFERPARLALSLAILELASRLPCLVRLERRQDRLRSLDLVHFRQAILLHATTRQLRFFDARYNDSSSGVDHRHTPSEQDGPPSPARLATLKSLPLSVSIRIISLADVCAMSLLSTSSLLSHECANSLPPRPSQARIAWRAGAWGHQARLHRLQSVRALYKLSAEQYDWV